MGNKQGRIKSDLKLFVIFALFIMAIILLALRVFGIMFVDNDKLLSDAYAQKTKETVTRAVRGDIFDRNGEVFSVTLSVSKFFLDPRLIKEVYGEYESGSEADKFLDIVCEALSLEKQFVIDQLKFDSHYRVIATDIPGETADRLILLRDEAGFKGLFREKSLKRYYPNGTLGAHVIGFTDTLLSGAAGLEYFYNSRLTGTDGISITEVDGLGREIPFGDEIHIDPEDGDSVYMTIDKTIQLFAQEALMKAVTDYKVKNGGCIIVMEPDSGKILALASYPEFDPNSPYDSEEDHDVDYLQQFVWRNKAVSDTYEPGSTFKVITAAACIEEGVVDTEEVIDASPVTVEGWEINHWMENPRPFESFREAMYSSSNPVFVRSAQKLGLNLFYRYVSRFGFKGITGIALPAEGNSLFRDRPGELDMAVNSFGQRFQITPLQLITAYSAVANGGYLPKPYIIDKITDNSGRLLFESEINQFRQVISENTSTILRDILEGTVTHGTGKNAYVKGYRVAGKTGTSETLQSDQGRYIASFAGFAPADSPRIAILVMLDFPTTEHHGGGYVAAPVAGNLIENILIYLRVERNYTEYDLEILSKETVFPDITDMNADEAEEFLRQKKINSLIVGKPGDKVIDQIPKAGSVVSENPILVLYTADKDVNHIRMPDLIGMTKQESVNKLKSLNLNVVYKGFGEVVSQSIGKGEMIGPGNIVVLELREMEFANGD